MFVAATRLVSVLHCARSEEVCTERKGLYDGLAIVNRPACVAHRVS